MPNYATIDRDDRIPFWTKVGEKVHEYDCKFIMQLSHSGRQRDISGVENKDLVLSWVSEKMGGKRGYSIEDSTKKRKPGKQPGAQGFGRTKPLVVEEIIPHYPDHCTACNQKLTAKNSKPYMGYYVLELKPRFPKNRASTNRGE